MVVLCFRKGIRRGEAGEFARAFGEDGIVVFVLMKGIERRSSA